MVRVFRHFLDTFILFVDSIFASLSALTFLYARANWAVRQLATGEDGADEAEGVTFLHMRAGWVMRQLATNVDVAKGAVGIEGAIATTAVVVATIALALACHLSFTLLL